MYEKLVGIAKETSFDIVGCATATENENGETTNNYIGIPEGEIKKEKVIENILEQKQAWGSVWNKIFNKKLFNNVRFPEGWQLEDYVVIMKLFTEANGIYFCQDAMYHYNSRSGSQSKRGWYEGKQTILDASGTICTYLESETYATDLSKSINYFAFSNYAQIFYQLHKSNATNKKEIMDKYKNKAKQYLLLNIKNGPNYWNLKLITKMLIALV